MASVDDQITNTIRCMAADVVQGANSGHPGAPMGMAPVAGILWTEVMKYNSADPSWFDRDRFVLSNGHASALQYVMLHLAGYDLSVEDLKAFRQHHSRTPGHPERGVTPGVEVTTGPLGQGLGNAVGLAMAEAHLAATFNKPEYELINHHTYAFCGDGCLMEGVALEALSLAGHLALDKLIIFYDDNKISIDGSTELAFTENTKQKYEALNFHVIVIENADSDYAAIRHAIAESKKVQGKPKLVILKTTIGYGALNQGTAKVHGAALGTDGVKSAKEKLGMDPTKFYYAAPEVYDAFKKHVSQNVAEQAKWSELVQKYEAEYPKEGAELRSRISGELLPAGWKDSLPLNDKSIATRKASENTLGALFQSVPALVGGSADLTGSNLTNPASAKLVDFQPKTPQGRYFRFGVREHGMGAIINGMQAHGGLIPFGGTFLNFVGYAQGAVRLSALSHHHVIWVATHDSIGLGEDGPTHQPTELVAGLRAMPNLLTFRPSDQTETSGAWAAALEHTHNPSVLCLSRQNTVPQPASSLEGVAKGGYTLVKAENPELVIVASGSEVSIAVDAAKALEGSLRVSVVSMPCTTLFDEQPIEYKKSVFPDGVPVLSVEPYVSFGWDRYSHYHVGINGFGGSAPAEKLYEQFQITTAHVTEVGKKLASHYPNGSAPQKFFTL